MERERERGRGWKGMGVEEQAGLVSRAAPNVSGYSVLTDWTQQTKKTKTH